MRKKLIVISLAYFFLLVCLSLVAPEYCINRFTMKGEYIIVCLEIAASVAIIYSLIVKFITNYYSWAISVALPVLTFFSSIVLIIIFSGMFNLNDFLGLQFYFYLQGLVGITLVYVAVKYF